jgi:hypothetical protein
MGRLGQADEIAYLATYLASDESGYTTGVHIDGGGQRRRKLQLLHDLMSDLHTPGLALNARGEELI